MCEKPLKSSATAKRIAMSGLSVSAQSPIQVLSMTLPSGLEGKLQSVTASTGHAGNGTGDCQTHASTSGLSSSGSQKQTYWIERNLHIKNRIFEFKVYKQNPDGFIWMGRDKPFAEWKRSEDWRIKCLPYGELESGLEPQQAAEEMRKLVGWR